VINLGSIIAAYIFYFFCTPLSMASQACPSEKEDFRVRGFRTVSVCYHDGVILAIVHCMAVAALADNRCPRFNGKKKKHDEY
jgi:hypothetical protein